MSDETSERADLIETLAMHRHFLRYTVRGLSDEEARRRTTVSELCLGGVVKHAALMEARWVDFIEGGPTTRMGADEDGMAAHVESFRMEGETLAGILERYDEIARRTERLIAELPSLDASRPLPEAPWFPPGTAWSARRVLLHILAETAQHAGHADILRESLDGAKTMG